MTNYENTHTEEIEFSGDMLIAKIKALLHEGNIRRVIIKNEEGHALIDIPLTVGVLGALGAIAALVTKRTLVVEKDEENSAE